MSPAIEPSVAGIRRAVMDHLKPPFMPAELWLIVLFVTTATNLIDFAVKPDPGMAETPLFVAAMVVRVIAVFWINFAIIRRMAGITNPFAPGLPLLRFGALTFLLAAGSGIFAVVANVAAGAEAEIADRWMARILSLMIWTAFTIGLFAWQAALAIDDPEFKLQGMHQRQRGKLTPLWLAFAAIILPFAAIHVALTMIGVKLALSPAALAALALVDGAASTVQLVATCALAVVAWKLASPLREGPAPR
ncbi:hypothetical protein ACFB49_37720 [Sphingomonas sp. DBB INV C78]|uniref:hypothetical protein n=1 Tax=Sphingomonas sp. DBB INV C78 TaxID=3349434 RepID=UPI0036D2DD71